MSFQAISIMVLVIIGIIGMIAAGALLTTGDGGFKRLTTLSGIYTVCRPDKYEVVCFLDADGKDGGMFCMPLSMVGGECMK